MKLTYMINPPKILMGEHTHILYKDILISTIQDNEIIGAYKYEYDFKSIPVSFLDIDYNHNYSIMLDDVKEVTRSDVTGTNRVSWTFNSAYEAFIQKLKCFELIKHINDQNIKENKEYFNSKIPDNISKIINTASSKKPEYFL